MIILSLDISSHTGYNVFDTERKSIKAKIKEYGIITIPANRDIVEKLWNFEKTIESLIIKYRPDVILREEFVQNVSGMVNKKGLFTTVKYHAMLDRLGYIHNINIVDIGVRTIPKALGLVSDIKILKTLSSDEKKKLRQDKREEKKINTIKIINKTYKLSLSENLKDKDDDIADSFGVLYTHMNK